ncbi:MAG: hypothetical protein JWQ43_2728 [Glaciihabitans sp.]|nr:hypothetical protein [Glaciihabitans sp.]
MKRLGGRSSGQKSIDAGKLNDGAPESAQARAQERRSLSQGWGRLLRGNRVIWVMASVAVVALVAGLGLGHFIVSPSQAAADAEAPKPGLITVPVESRTLTNDVTIRGDATYADSVDVVLETGELGGPAVVTGQVPEVGSVFDAASIALEVTGRPVIVLPGDLPVYRTLRVGVAGPDVLQLKQALASIGIEPGNSESDVFDAATSAAIDALYDRVGYPAPSAGAESTSVSRSATEAVASGREALAQAQAALVSAQAGASLADRVEQENLVRTAQRALTSAQQLGVAAAIGDAEDAVALAIVRRDTVNTAKNTAEETAAVTAATQQLTNAEADLVTANEASMTYLPAAEVLYLPGLPRRVDEISVSRGSTISGAAMRVSGATLVISASAAEADSQLLTVGNTASLAMPDDSVIGATITSIAPATTAGTETATASGRFTVMLTPDELTPEQLQSIQGNNVRVTIAVSSTDGDVLAVPLAALTAGAGGESRVEIATGTGLESELVEVTTGLAAEGFVEVADVTGTLAAGSLVVVGR